MSRAARSEVPSPRLRHTAPLRAIAIRYCAKCGERHHDREYKLCLTCRLLGRDWAAAYRADHALHGLCVTCVDAHSRGRIRCQHHLEYERELAQKIRDDQAENGLCRWARCQEPSDGYYCERHTEHTNELRREARAKRARRTRR
jgi:hypothetical protein